MARVVIPVHNHHCHGRILATLFMKWLALLGTCTGHAVGYVYRTRTTGTICLHRCTAPFVPLRSAIHTLTQAFNRKGTDKLWLFDVSHRALPHPSCRAFWSYPRLHKRLVNREGTTSATETSFSGRTADQPSTLHPQCSTLNPKALNPQHAALNPCYLGP